MVSRADQGAVYSETSGELTVPNVPFYSMPYPRRIAGFTTAAVVAFMLAFAAVAASGTVPLAGTYWRLARMNGETVQAAAGTSLPHIALHAETERVAGFGGCNRFFGRYSIADPAISIQPLGGSRASCPDTNGLERAFIAALAAVDHYVVSGGQLTLSSDGRAVLVFDAVADATNPGAGP